MIQLHRNLGDLNEEVKKEIRDFKDAVFHNGKEVSELVGRCVDEVDGVEFFLLSNIVFILGVVIFTEQL